MCQHLGGACACRLAVALSRCTGPVTSVSFPENKLSKLPDAIGALPDLEVADVSDNCLTELHESIWSQSPTLKELDASNNQIESIDADELAKGGALRKLWLAGNPIVERADDAAVASLVRTCKEHGIELMVSGSRGESSAVDAMQGGATDDNDSARQ